MIHWHQRSSPRQHTAFQFFQQLFEKCTASDRRFGLSKVKIFRRHSIEEYFRRQEGEKNRRF